MRDPVVGDSKNSNSNPLDRPEKIWGTSIQDSHNLHTIISASTSTRYRPMKRPDGVIVEKPTYNSSTHAITFEPTRKYFEISPRARPLSGPCHGRIKHKDLVQRGRSGYNNPIEPISNLLNLKTRLSKDILEVRHFQEEVLKDLMRETGRDGYNDPFNIEINLEDSTIPISADRVDGSPLQRFLDTTGPWTPYDMRTPVVEKYMNSSPQHDGLY